MGKNQFDYDQCCSENIFCLIYKTSNVPIISHSANKAV